MNPPDQPIFLTIIGFTTLFLLLSGFIIAFALRYQKRKNIHILEMTNLKQAYEQELLKTQLETQEETFQQISQELHDNVGQLLSSTKMLLGITERQLETIPDTLITAEETLGKAIQDLRSLSKSLNKEWLDQFNVIDNLKAEADRINTARAVAVTFDCNSTKLPLKAESQIMLFRIVQEALQNSIKHAAATKININIQLQENKIDAALQDNGKGFDKNDVSNNGIGLINMKHRTELLGGTIDWITMPHQGTQVLIHLPIQVTAS
jgi:signal transduction histidine kinase